MVGGEVYVLVERSGVFMIEAFDDDYNVDAGLKGTADTSKSTWSGMDHLEGKTIKVVADGTPLGEFVVAGGQITIDVMASAVEAGLGFTHIIEPLPPTYVNPTGGTQGGRVRPIAFTFRVRDTAALRLDVGHGLQDVPFKRFGAHVLDQPLAPFTGDKKVRAFGWRAGDVTPLWRIEQDTPTPFTLLAVASEISVNG
jgi:hypothetical protein